MLMLTQASLRDKRETSLISNVRETLFEGALNDRKTAVEHVFP